MDLKHRETRARKVSEQRTAKYIPSAENIDCMIMACDGAGRVILQCY